MASPEGVSVQTVKLKVLYTFDTESKDNHLARWPQSLEVNTCFIDNAAQIGVIDLRTCLEAVITASPELTSRADQDYAVYAYDYSEEDTPLVGQGMLSKTLAMQDETLEQDSEAMITGKITKALMGLLSKYAQPTLEVKLRFKPIAVGPGQRPRSGSVSSQDGRPPWLQNDNGLQNHIRPSSPMDTSGLESMQRMLRGGGLSRERNASIAPDAYNHSRPGSRAGTPTHVQSYGQPQRQPADIYSRPDSRNGIRQPAHGRRDSFNSGYYSGEDAFDDEPAKKRAKTSKVDWPTKSSFNIERQHDSLRMAASGAQSVRIHRPVPLNPAAMLQNGQLGEEPVRPPTPIPAKKTGKPRGRPRKTAPSNLAPPPPPPVNHTSPTNLPPPSDALDTAVSSPEDGRAGSASTTPANIPSSPPIIFEHPGPLITSPALPPMMHHDSGFMSGNLEDLFDDNNLLRFEDFILEKPQDQQADVDNNQTSFQADNHFAPVLDESHEMEPPPLPMPHPSQSQKVVIPPPPPRPMSRSQSFTPAARVGMSSPKLAPAPIPRARQIMEEQRAKGLLPQLPQSEPERRSLQRSNTWAPDSDALMSEAVEGEDSQKPKSKKKVGKEQTKARLENAIAAGEIPPYCDNCGAIETPAWRRGWVKVFDGVSWSDVETSLSFGGVVFKEIIDRDPDGSINSFRGYKTDKIPDDESQGWKQICLCNPCGLWFHKQKCPRPKEKWQRKGEGKGKRKRAPKKASKKHPNAKSDAPTPMSDDSSPADTATEAPDYDDNDNDYYDTNTGEDDSNEPQLPLIPQHMRSSSAEPIARGLARVRPHHRPAIRQVQSSPGRRGSEAEPIEVELTPKPLRRQLFPSPSKPQIRSDPGSLTTTGVGQENMPHFVRRSPRINKTKDIFQIPGIAGAIALTADGKENIMPDYGADEQFDTLLQAVVDDYPIPPTTPTLTRRSERIFLKTPRQFGTERSPNAQSSPIFKTPKAKPGQHPVATALLGTVTAGKSLSELTPISRTIEETLSGAYDMGILSPWKGSKRTTPGKNIFDLPDLPDLPSLNSSSPTIGGDHLFNISYSEMPTEINHTDMLEPFSTDALMPSSPPGGYMDFINTDHLDDSADWETTTPNTQQIESVYPDPELLSMALPSQMLRRSPRKNK